MGLGPLMAIYQARFLKYLGARRVAATEGRKVWAFLGDGETDEPESLGAISLAGRESVASTDPQVAWTGDTQQRPELRTATFPWAASGRSLSLGRSEGLTKLFIDEQTHRIVGAGVVGTNAGELISEISLAIELGAEVGDLAHTIHPHPTLSETVGLSAEVWEGTVTDLYLPRRSR